MDRPTESRPQMRTTSRFVLLICGSSMARWKRSVAFHFDVTRGEIFGLIGPDGAGKTTTFQILAGVMEATSGAAIFSAAPHARHVLRSAT